ncbi:hypothetical protein [Spirillospora sp. CA-294931]|uniref:hypothetical protein n=1 Tax=Spirillospora sp. CA-294931 TaxID=3240042 RepID=UPI003D8B956B
MIDMSALAELKGRVQSWVESRKDLSERDGALNTPGPNEWGWSDDEASNIVDELADVLGIS